MKLARAATLFSQHRPRAAHQELATTMFHGLEFMDRGWGGVNTMYPDRQGRFHGHVARASGSDSVLHDHETAAISRLRTCRSLTV